MTAGNRNLPFFFRLPFYDGSLRVGLEVPCFRASNDLESMFPLLRETDGKRIFQVDLPHGRVCIGGALVPREHIILEVKVAALEACIEIARRLDQEIACFPVL